MKTSLMTLSFGVAGILTTTTATAAATTNSGTGGFQLPSQTCIGPANTTAVGTQLQVGTCSAFDTIFTLEPSDSGSTSPTAQGTIRVDGLCLDAASGTPEFNNCNFTTSQEWTWLPATSALQSVSTGQCLNAAGFSAGSGVSLAGCQLEDNQSFTPVNFNMMFVSGIVSSSTEFGPHPAYLPPKLPASAVADSTVGLTPTQALAGAAEAASGGGTLPFSGNVDDVQCLDTFLDLETLANDQIDDFQCNATNAQWYHFTTGQELETEANTCVTATAGSAGAAVNVEACNGSPGQQWLYAGGHLFSALDADVLATYCLDVQGESGTPLTPLVVNNCGYENWPVGQNWWGNVIWPSNTFLYATQILGGPSVYANVKLALSEAGQFTMTPTIDNHDQLTGYDYVLTCNIGPFAVGYQGNVGNASFLEISGPGVDTPGTIGVIDTGITANWTTLSGLWAAGAGNPNFGCQLSVTSTLSQTLQQVEQYVADAVLQQIGVNPTTFVPNSASCVLSGGDVFTCGTDPRSCVVSGASQAGGTLDCEPDNFPTD